MPAYDEIAMIEAEDEFKAWVFDLFDAKDEIVAFVSMHRPGRSKGEFDGYLKGSFNLCVRVRFQDEGPKAIIRFPKPGHTLTARREEKVKNEVGVLQFLEEKTNLPVPHIVTWGLTEQSPQQLGPFIIMDYIDGTSLLDLLEQPTKSENDHVMLRLDIEDEKLDYVYEQLAEFMIELVRLDFDSIGTIVQDSDTKKWLATDKPFTYNMNEMGVCVKDYPIGTFPNEPFSTTKEFLEYQSEENLTHLQTQRNLARDAEDAQRMYIARLNFRKLIPQFCMHNQGPFKLFCDDLQPSNMLADPETLKITAILDWEFTHAMPAQLSYDPPWWLLLKGPSMWLENFSMEEFLVRYKPRLEQFICAMKRVEARSPPADVKLSFEMQRSWDTGRFWFDYGIRKSMDVDEIYWGAFHREGDEVLDEKQQMQMEEFVAMKVKHLKEYDKECKDRGL